jgi:phosphopantetheinyl transferase (holo-ACP synthase)
VVEAVGLDLERLDALDRLGPRTSVLSARWLSPVERAWCGRQLEPARAFVVVWSCREAAFKAAATAGSPYAIRLRLSGTIVRGRARAWHARRVVAEVAWRRLGRHVASVAVSAGAGAPGLAHRLISLVSEEDADAHFGHGGHGVHRHGTGAAPS